jgi:hypothetical protein
MGSLRERPSGEARMYAPLVRQCWIMYGPCHSDSNFAMAKGIMSNIVSQDEVTFA